MKTKIKSLSPLFATLAIGALLCVGCMTTNSDTLHKDVLAWVPIGTPVEDARHIMEGRGFRCELTHFEARAPWAGPILRCRRINRVLNRTWVVNLFLENNRMAGSMELIVGNPLRIEPGS